MRIKSIGRYLVYENGTVYSIKHKRFLRPVLNQKGYGRADIWLNGKLNRIAIHRLIATLFIPNQNNCEEINHKDENKLNNNVENLEWCTHKYNSSYGTRNERISKTMKILKGKKNEL